MEKLQLLGYSRLEKERVQFYQCPKCRATTECLSCGEDHLPACWKCRAKIPVPDWGETKVLRWVATCAACGHSDALTPRRHSMSGPFYICAPCDNMVAAYYGHHRLVSPPEVLGIDWNPTLQSRLHSVGDEWRYGVCQSAKDHLPARLLNGAANAEGHGFLWGDQSEHSTMLWGDRENYIAYLLWTVEDRPRAENDSKRVLRQIYVAPPRRRHGLATTMIRTWAEAFAFPYGETFRVESPTSETKRILARLE